MKRGILTEERVQVADWRHVHVREEEDKLYVYPRGGGCCAMLQKHDDGRYFEFLGFALTGITCGA